MAFGSMAVWYLSRCGAAPPASRIRSRDFAAIKGRLADGADTLAAKQLSTLGCALSPVGP